MAAAASRIAAKVLLLDPAGRVLLFRGFDRTKPEKAPWWLAVGGALNDGDEVSAIAIAIASTRTYASTPASRPVVDTA